MGINAYHSIITIKRILKSVDPAQTRLINASIQSMAISQRSIGRICRRLIILMTTWKRLRGQENGERSLKENFWKKRIRSSSVPKAYWTSFRENIRKSNVSKTELILVNYSKVNAEKTQKKKIGYLGAF